MAKTNRSVLTTNDQQFGDVADPNKLESSIKHAYDVVDGNDDEFITHKNKQVDVTDSNTTKDKHVSNSDLKVIHDELAKKTVKTGNHEGTWRGLTPGEASESVNGGRLDTIEKRLSVSVTDFGAVGDGIADDTQAIQEAIDSVRVSASGKDGALVYFPSGTYLISNTIKTYGNITLQGVGRTGSTLLLSPSTTATAMIAREDDGSEVYWVQIRDIHLDGQASQQTADTVGIKIENVHECFIQNVGVRYVRNHAIQIIGVGSGLSSVQPTIINCLIRADVDNHTSNACGILLDSQSYDGMISGNDIGFYKTGHGIMLNGHNGAFLSDNNVWQCKNGYRFVNSNRIRIDNSLSDYAEQVGIYFEGCQEFQLSNCQSRWSSNSSVETYDSINLYDCSDFVIDGTLVLGGDGNSTVADGTGQTAYAIALTGTTTRGRIGSLITKNVIGDYYRDAGVSEVYQLFNIQNQSGIQYVGSGSNSVTVSLPETMNNNNYMINVTPTWGTTFWVTNVTTAGFTINFGTTPSTGSNCYWEVKV